MPEGMPCRMPGDSPHLSGGLDVDGAMDLV